MAANARWLVFGLLSTLLRTEAGSDLHQLPELCPYSNFCTHRTNRTLDDPALQSCCSPCSCSPDCALVGKCCPDATDVRPPWKVYPCRTQAEIYASYLNYPFLGSDSRQYFHVIDDCPDEAHQVSDLADSVARCHSAGGVEDLAFATGTVSGLTYLNKHCARCNNDVVVTEWNLYVLNRDILSEATSFEERDRRILSTGDVMSVPTVHDLAPIALCSTYIITTCNETKVWDIYDAEIEFKCNSVGGSVEYFSDEACSADYYCEPYANVYCFLCNHPTGVSLQSQCQRVTVTPVIKDVLKDVPFSAVLTATPKPVKAEKTRCAIGEFLNPFHMMSCTQLYCPVGTVAVYGVCTPLVEHELGFLVYVTMEIALDNDGAADLTSNLTADMYPYIMKDVARVVKRRVNNRTTACELCSVDIMEDKRTGALYTSADFLSTATCSVAALLQGMSRLFRSSTTLSVVLPSTRLSVTLTNVRGPPTDSDGLDIGYVIDVFKPCSTTGTQFLVNETIVCPSIDLSYEDMRGLGHNGNAFDLILSISVDVGNRKSRVCVADYVDILRVSGLISGERRPASPTLFAIFVTTLLSLKVDHH